MPTLAPNSLATSRQCQHFACGFIEALEPFRNAQAGIELRTRRMSAGIPGRVLSAKAGMSRTRLSDIERGYVRPVTGELDRIYEALNLLIEAHEKIAAIAKECGWPTPF
jgi:AraC-like DNA-binding protein